MSTALVIISDGRGYLSESVPSLIATADPSWFSHCLIVEDGPVSFLPQRAAFMLREWLGFNPTTTHHNARRGGAASIQTAWKWVERTTDVTHIFHLEEDFTFPGPIPLPEMLAVLETDRIANVVLRRGPHGTEGPNGYIDDSYAGQGDHLRHRNGFWLSPCVYPRAVTDLGWPDHGHEHDFTARALEAGYEFAVYGTRDDPPRCTHIGDRRAAAWTW